MTFEQYWTIAVKQWKTIAICFIIVGSGTYLVSKLLTPIYQSTAVVQVTIRSANSQSDINNLLASDQLVQTEAQLAISDPVLRRVAASYPALTVDQLTKEVTSTPELNTQLFQITVQDASPKRAADLANAIAATLLKVQEQVTEKNNAQAQQQIQQDLQSTRQEIDTITRQIAALSSPKGSQPAQIATLQAQLSGLQQHYSQWQNALAQLELTQAQSGDFLLVAQEAQPALHPIRPNVLINTGAGLLGGLLLGILLAVLFSQLDTRVRSAEALAQLLNWPVQATVWRARSKDKEEIVNPRGRDANVEAYRILRTNVGFAGVDKPIRLLTVTSAVPQEGKSVIAANLAIFMAKAGKSTLLVDADLRRPTLHEKFDLAADKKGLSNAILAFGSSSVPGTLSRLDAAASLQQSGGNALLTPFVHPVDIPHLYVMPSGPLPPNPSELLDSKAMERLLATLATCGIEVVIFDTPPLLGLSDASILASKVDGTLVVADITRANKKNLKQVQALLAQAGARVLGCVVNKQSRSRKNTPYSYYYYTAEPTRDVSEKNTVPVTIPKKQEASSK
jgi:tyrosine-protein kinase